VCSTEENNLLDLLVINKLIPLPIIVDGLGHLLSAKMVIETCYQIIYYNSSVRYKPLFGFPPFGEEILTQSLVYLLLYFDLQSDYSVASEL
jgi:hypothetical protein